MDLSNGEDLLNTFGDVNVDLRNLNPNVIKAWFDTDCKTTIDLLNWMCISLSDVNYVSPLERAEFTAIQEQLDANKCKEALAKVNPNYLSILDDSKMFEDIVLKEDEIDLLEEENRNLDKLITIYENISSNISLDLTHKTQIEIQSKVEGSKSQETCENLCKNLDEFNKKLQKTLVRYDQDSHIVNFINVKDYKEISDNFNSFLVPLMTADKTLLEVSDEYFSDDLEIWKKRILHSQQIYLANKVETEKVKEILEFLNTTDANESIIGWNSLNGHANLEAKEVSKKRMCETFDTIALKLAEHYLNQARIPHIKQKLQEFQEKSQNVSKILENLTKCLSYYAVTNCLQIEENKDVKCINNFYQKMVKYVNQDLHSCRARTEQMQRIIEDYKLNQAKPAYERSKLISAITKILSSESNTLKSAADAIGKFKAELNRLESQLICMDFGNEKENMQQMNNNIRILETFLLSGPTNRVVLVPLELQKAWAEIEEHLRKESFSVGQAIQIPQTVKKTMTKAQNYTKQLWMDFLADPSKLDSILEQAEEDFNKRTERYF